jgi:hypothetical protein
MTPKGVIPFFEALLWSLHLALILGLVFLDENLAPPRAGDDNILVLEKRCLGTLILDGLICTPGGFHETVVLPKKTTTW